MWTTKNIGKDSDSHSLFDRFNIVKVDTYFLRSKNYFLNHLAKIKEELKSIMTVFEENNGIQLAREKLSRLIDVCDSDEKLPLPDLLNESIEKLKELGWGK